MMSYFCPDLDCWLLPDLELAFEFEEEPWVLRSAADWALEAKPPDDMFLPPCAFGVVAWTVSIPGLFRLGPGSGRAPAWEDWMRELSDLDMLEGIMDVDSVGAFLGRIVGLLMDRRVGEYMDLWEDIVR